MSADKPREYVAKHSYYTLFENYMPDFATIDAISGHAGRAFVPGDTIAWSVSSLCTG